MTIRERTMHTRRCHTSWLEAGAGWPVILLHGFPLNADMWRPQLAEVPAGWRFICPDLRGFGPRLPPRGETYGDGQKDSWPPPSGGSGHSVDDYAADVLDLMDCLEIDDAVMGGVSMGGYVTFAMYRQAPARFHGMVLADTRAQADTPQGREGRLKLREVLAAQGARGVADGMLPKLLSPAAGPEVVAGTRALIEGADPAAIDAAIDALMSRPDSTPGLAAIACATLVVVGEHDEITPLADARAMQEAIPRSTLCVIPGAGHLSSLEQPAAFSRALADFLLARL
jgi:pimeloyl-ACP methyl ester carboxylesterase